MSDQTSYIASLCSKLRQQGKQPSVALIRKMANRPLPLPMVISVLQKWKDDPSQLPILAEEDEATTPMELTSDQRIFALETRVKELESVLSKVVVKLDQL